MAKKNCWEEKKCGRQPGGEKVVEYGECPAVGCFKAHRVNDGINGGRACWAITGTYCGGTVQGTFASKMRDCANCDFFDRVAKEEKKLVPAHKILEIIGS
ncbi:MAG: two-CW domain-containing protein [Nitrospirota bacterium]